MNGSVPVVVALSGEGVVATAVEAVVYSEFDYTIVNS